MHKARSFFLIGMFALSACTSQDKPDNSSKKYFDLAGFFKNEAARLQKSNPLIEKEIAKNELKESRELKIRNWSNELNVFIESDINKSAWKDAYEAKTTSNGIEYIARQTDLRTKKIIIERFGNTIKHILILNNVSNSLYSSSEELDYYPDSLYLIRKKQKVVLMGSNDYFIKGLFNRVN